MNMLSWMMVVALSVLSPAFAGSTDGSLVAEKKNAPSEAVKVRVWTVHASNQTKGVGEGLGRIEKHLRNLNYTGFSLLSKDGASVLPKASKKFNVVGDKSVRVTVLSKDEKRARVRVQVTSPQGKLLDTTVSIRRNGFFMVAGPRHKKGVLVLPIFARY